MDEEREFYEEEIEAHNVTCGSTCGHFDSFNLCCWLSWWNKEEGDHCNYGLQMVDGEVYTPQEMKLMRENARRRAKYG